MKKLIKISVFLILAAFAASSLSGCLARIEPAVSSETSDSVTGSVTESGTEFNDSGPASIPVQWSGDVSVSDFDAAFFKYILDSELGEGSFMASPLSLRYALALAAAGAKGETLDQIVKAAGFSTMDEFTEWALKYNGMTELFNESVRREQAEFEKYPEVYGNRKPDERILRIANSVWQNSSTIGPLSDRYLGFVKDNFDADCFSVPQKEIKDKANKWVNDKTNGLIPTVFDEEVKADVVLINSLYMKEAWSEEFSKCGKDVFTGREGRKAETEFMEKTGHFRYYSDNETQIVVVPMRDGVRVAFVLGNAAGLSEKLAKATYEKVHVKVPMFENKTTVSGDIILPFLQGRGMVNAFEDGAADFTGMSDSTNFFIDDIFQSTKIKFDEQGVEAAAVTVIMMAEASSAEPVVKPIDFIADHTFSYFIYASADDMTNMLFFGVYAGD
ncbi:MAG: hypothetical protein IKS28_09135 [Clostridia bacterium]|nr:hypothetical protein [Clostridia bacterium]